MWSRKFYAYVRFALISRHKKIYFSKKRLVRFYKIKINLYLSIFDYYFNKIYYITNKWLCHNCKKGTKDFDIAGT